MLADSASFRWVSDDVYVVDRIVSALSTRQVVEGLGTQFAVFDAHTQDSGHVSYGVEDGDGRRWFAKTAGENDASPGGTSHAERVAALRRAADLQAEIDHRALVTLKGIVDATDGVVVIYEWFRGELLRSPATKRSDPAEASSRFRGLRFDVIAAAVDAVIDLHVLLEGAGWIAGDFYDGSLMYNFEQRQIKVIDLESYHHGAYVNKVGRLPGSTRYMAPEEHTQDATIDARTTVFNLGRMIEILLSEHNAPRLAHLTTKTTSATPQLRPESVRALQIAWRQATH